jgi:sulfur carrier protein
MTITVNGRPLAFSGGTIEDLLRALGRDPAAAGIAVAVGDEVVARADWASRRLREGDRVELVGAAQGG